MVQHLQLLVAKEWKLSKHNLSGHLFGGILAYEYLAKVQSKNGNGCQSFLLASAPTLAALIEQESKCLYKELNNKPFIKPMNVDSIKLLLHFDRCLGPGRADLLVGHSSNC
jgi:surfactin synthase thioesterase subunit